MSRDIRGCGGLSPIDSLFSCDYIVEWAHHVWNRLLLLPCRFFRNAAHVEGFNRARTSHSLYRNNRPYWVVWHEIDNSTAYSRCHTIHLRLHIAAQCSWCHYSLGDRTTGFQVLLEQELHGRAPSTRWLLAHWIANGSTVNTSSIALCVTRQGTLAARDGSLELLAMVQFDLTLVVWLLFPYDNFLIAYTKVN